MVADRGAVERLLQLEQKSIPSRFSAADAAVSLIFKKKNLPDVLYFTLVPEYNYNGCQIYCSTWDEVTMPSDYIGSIRPYMVVSNIHCGQYDINRRES